MLLKTDGIALHSVKYRESSIIVYMYTSEFGRQSFLINSVRKKNSKVKMNIFHPLSLLNMEVYFKSNRDLHRIKDVQIKHPFISIPFNLKKNTISLFLAEILYKTLREQESNPHLFSFLSKSIQYLDLHEEGIANFHIYFLLQLTKFLGFYPDNNYSERNCYFNLKDGNFSLFPGDIYILAEKASYWIHTFLLKKIGEIASVEINHFTRVEILEGLIQYYMLHIENIGEIKSFSVLKEVFQ